LLAALDKAGVSVVICTYNGKERIKPTLKHLASQTDINFDWEVLIIDNNSNDNTASVAAAYWQTLNPPCELKIISELRPGTMYARASGIINAGYRYLVFCDDDNWLVENFIKIAYAAIKGNSDIAAVGGMGILVFETDFKIPAWLNKYANYFGSGPQGAEDGDTTENKGCLYTAGAILDRVWLNRLYDAGFESFLKGRDSKSLVAGEDTELTYALKLIGGRLFFCSEMQFNHFMPSGRMNWNYLVRLSNAMGYSNYLLRPYSLIKRQFITDYLITTGLIIKYFTKALFGLFKEGNDNMIIYSFFIGQLRAVTGGESICHNLTTMVSKLKQIKEQ
jgi:glycosyltransferase involved in cell wall biosynthesis